MYETYIRHMSDVYAPQSDIYIRTCQIHVEMYQTPIRHIFTSRLVRHLPERNILTFSYIKTCKAYTCAPAPFGI